MFALTVRALASAISTFSEPHTSGTATETKSQIECKKGSQTDLTLQMLH